MNNKSSYPGRATAPGSSNYYCVRVAPRELHTDLALIFEWQHELKNILQHCSDQTVALAKLQWYRDELTGSLKHKTQHPMLQTLASVIQKHQLETQLFTAIADGLESDIRGIIHQDSKALLRYCRLSGGSLLELLTIIGGGTRQEFTCARELGSFIQLTEIIRNLGQDLHLGCCHLPREEMEQHNLNPTKLAKPQNEKALQSLLTALSITAQNRYNSALKTLPSGKHPALTPALALAAMSNTLLNELNKTAFPVIQQRVSLTPLRKLWIVWRIRRQYQ